MTPDELQAVTARVRAVADRIQPMLAPHAGLAKRNAHAHVWLGLKVVFGAEWRERAAPGSVHALLEWIGANPSGDYQEYRGPKEEQTAEARGDLF